MDVVRSFDSGCLGPPKGLYVTIGNFDGVHVGHQAVLGELTAASRSGGGRAVAVTFDPHPSGVVGGADGPGLLTPGEEKVEFMSRAGLTSLVVVPFTRETAASSARSFLERLGVGSGSHLVLGYDFQMGKGRAADLAKLSLLGREVGFGLDVVPPVLFEGKPVSSTRIREALARGDARSAARMLARPYRLGGTVVRGDGIGNKLGVPTANLALPEDKLLPGDGVYLVSVAEVGGRPGLLYVGTRPTLGAGQRRAEVHVLDLSADLYGALLTVDIEDFLRGDRSFATVEELKHQMTLDLEKAGRSRRGPG